MSTTVAAAFEAAAAKKAEVVRGTPAEAAVRHILSTARTAQATSTKHSRGPAAGVHDTGASAYERSRIQRLVRSHMSRPCHADGQDMPWAVVGSSASATGVLAWCQDEADAASVLSDFQATGSYTDLASLEVADIPSLFV